jgi:hypothetical protein
MEGTNMKDLEQLLLFLRWMDNDAGYECWSRLLMELVYYPDPDNAPITLIR